MPLSVAIQLALCRLLESWNIKPSAVTGHSSGEISAAFAAGVLDIREALATAYFRGLIADEYLVQDKSISGCMMAVGLGPEAAEPYLERIKTGRVVIACINSPSSVTLSGDTTGINEIEAELKAEGVFARKLQVPAAYHSHHMTRPAERYRSVLEEHLCVDERKNLCLQNILFSSPVTGGWIRNAKELGPSHWVNNMLQPVLFAQSLCNMCVGFNASGAETIANHIDTVVEIGPHGALAGPIRQSISSSPELKDKGIGYASCLNRGTDAIQTMQTLAAGLLEQGYPVNIVEVNFPHGTESIEVAQLPSYPWNHSTKFWMEPRKNRDFRLRKHPHHDLLGSLMAENNMLSPTWRNIIRPVEVPWVRDHIVDDKMAYPAAGQIAMAIEAVRQLTVANDEACIVGYVLRDIEIMKALIIPDTIQGAEVHVCLNAPHDRGLSKGWREFHIYSIPEMGEWIECSKGLISVRTATPSSPTPDWHRVFAKTREIDFNVRSGAYNRLIEVKNYFDWLHALDIKHGEMFQNLDEIRYGNGQSVTAFHVSDTAILMPGGVQSPHLIHPITLDAVFQAAYTVLTPQSRAAVGTAVPQSIKNMFIARDISSVPGHKFQNFCKLHYASAQGFDLSMALVDRNVPNAAPILEISEVHFQSLGTSVKGEMLSDENKLCLKMDWVHDLSVVKREAFSQSIQGAMSAQENGMIEDLKRATFYFIDDALKELTENDTAQLNWHQKTFVDWLRYQRERAANNDIAPKSSRWSKAGQGTKQRLWDLVAATSVNGEMLVRMGGNLLGILRNELTPLELMMEDKLLYKFYENLLRMDRSLKQVEKLVNTFSYAYPRARVLEIGAGTGVCTRPALRALSNETGVNPRFSRYDFTDISSGFFETARENFAAWEHLMAFKKLDIEGQLEEQGFELGSYDLIIACMVLHATADMEHTLTNVRKLLKPGGKLILVETTQDSMDIQLVFGTLPGWWLSKEPERKYSPNLPLNMWIDILSHTGFSDPDITIRDSEDDRNYSMSVIMSTALPNTPAEYPEQAVLTYFGSLPPREWLDQLQESIKLRTGVTPAIESLDKLNPAGKVAIFVSEIDSPLLDGMDAESFNSVKALCTESKGVLWLTRGAAVECLRPELALHTGLLRARRLEDASKRYIALDLDPLEPAWSISSLDSVVDIFSKAFDYATEKNTLEFEYAVRNGNLLIPRISVDHKEHSDVLGDASDNIPEMQPFFQSGRELRMIAGTPGVVDSPAFIDDPDAGQPLEEGSVEIETKAFGVNPSDAMISTGQPQENAMGFECSGIITRVGPGASHEFRIGDRVCAFTGTRGHHWAQKVRVHYTSVANVPDAMSLENAASVPMAFGAAYYSLFEKARLEKGETVLIHAAAGDVGQAAILLAKSAGAEVFATVSSLAERELVKDVYGIPDSHIFSSSDTSFATDLVAATNGQGVDVVLNSLAGDLLQESLYAMARFGRFIDIGGQDIQANKRLEMGPFSRAISFLAVDLVQIAEFQPKTMHRILNECLGLFKQNAIQLIQPVTVYPISDIQLAFQSMRAGKHLGKIVIKPNEDDLVNVLPRKKAIKLHPDASYLISGGLGALGRSIAQLLAFHGANHLILLSRSATSRTNYHAFVKQLTDAGCNVVVKDCDISNANDLRHVMNECYIQVPAVRGVIHAAAVLDVSVFFILSMFWY
jgi:NADPH:quinone reductase-like Zn-dependent oxidoreductase/malonyl CoA-acyl carrier protein transacylase/ubiquinone/menaquinone biosynthesis C-methylase UbiE